MEKFIQYFFIFLLFVFSNNINAQADFEQYFFETDWVLSEYNIYDTDKKYEGASFEQRIEEFKNEFEIGKVYFEFGENYRYVFDVQGQKKQRFNGVWALTDENQNFNIYSDKTYCVGCSVNFDFQFKQLDGEHFSLTFTQQEEDTTFSFELVFSKK